MTSIIKNQLVKHLSKFTKNLKPEQISLDVLKGNSKLQFIEINEEVLTNILELPNWLKIKRAFCTGVTVNVPWTKLKTCPIQIFIDEINVDVELTSEQSSTSKSNPLGNLADSTSYGFINRIIENLSLYINTVEINFDSDVFGGSFMLQRLSLESRSPGWAQVKDLRQTRVTCPVTNRSLMFKQLSWHLLRIEASAKTSKNEQRSKINAPLRLITSGGKIRIALKKNINDGSVIHARIQTILDDILWVATLPQLRSAISFASYIANLVQGSQKDALDAIATPVESSMQKSAGKDTPDARTTSSAYNIFHFDQTSYHLHVKKIDLHLCDDAHTASDYPPNWDIESGAMQVTLMQVLIDIYPKSRAMSDRTTWMRYPNPNPIAAWVQQHLAEQLKNLQSKTEDQTLKTRLERCWPQLIGFFVVMRVYDLTVQCVSDMNTKKDALTNLFQSERHLRHLPSDQQIVHIEFANFYHPLTDTLPVPNAAVYFQIGPFSFTFDERTTRWCFYVANTLQSAIEDGKLIPQNNDNIQAPTIKLNLVMPRIIINLPSPVPDYRFPNRLVVAMSTLSISSSPNDFAEQRCFRSLNASVDHLNETHRKVAGSLKHETNRFEIATSPVWIETDNGPQTKGLPLLHDVSFIGMLSLIRDKVNLIVEPNEDIAVIVDHFQFLQLTRTGEQFNKFFDVLSADIKHYNANKQSSDVELEFLSNIARIRVFVILAMGEIASPYDTCPPVINNFNHSFMDRLSDITSTKSVQDGPVYNDVKELKPKTENEKKINLNTSLENFPEFPKERGEYDSSPMLDETASITTSIDDEATFDYDGLPSDDPFGMPDVAEEAITIDEIAMNDRAFRSTMAKPVNLFMVNLEDLQLAGSISEGNVGIEGRLRQILLDERLAIIRSEINDLMRKVTGEKAEVSSNIPWTLNLKLTTAADEKVSHLTIDINQLKASLDDEIVTHLGAFAKDNQVTENRLRLAIHINDSNIQIVDRKKSKPLRLRIKALSIEQDED